MWKTDTKVRIIGGYMYSFFGLNRDVRVISGF